MEEIVSKEIISYILSFLLGEKNEGELSKLVGYTSDVKLFSQYKIVVYPSGFFTSKVYGTIDSLPSFPLQEQDDTPILFGEPRVEQVGDTTVVYADVVASTYFLITRYEEMVRRDVRDEHGRFPGRESILGKIDKLYRPVVDEYGYWLKSLLRTSGVEIEVPLRAARKIYLTHDVDAIAHYRSLRGLAGAVLKKCSQLGVALRSFFGGIQHDPWFTFSWLLEQNALLEHDLVETIFFIKPGGGRSKEDRPHSDVESRDFQYLFQMLRDSGARFGLHASYEAGKHPELIAKEKAVLEQALGQPIVYNRHHYLASREPEDMQALIDAGITDDFTMGYADMVGFRLGTCRPVRWINPVTRQLTPLTLHPLTAMDGTLSEAGYMGLSEREALLYLIDLIEETENYQGDFCLLWHNTSVTSEGYHRNLYKKVIPLI